MSKPAVTVEAVQGSTCKLTGKPISTYLCDYPRTLHAELLTHRVFSKNSASTRAIPTLKAIENVNSNPAQYLWTSNKPGMAGNKITDAVELAKAEMLYNTGLEAVSKVVAALGLPKDKGGLGIHKQHACRLLEPFSNMKVLITSTEWTNFDWLRDDEMAFPEIALLAKELNKARKSLEYIPIRSGEYHVPFVLRYRNTRTNELEYYHPETQEQLTVTEAIQLSMSLSAQTSYRKEDASDEKTADINQKLFGGDKVHASPSEHQATPFSGVIHDLARVTPAYKLKDHSAALGLTAIDLNGNLRSGNFVNWLQHRQTIPNHDKALY